LMEFIEMVTGEGQPDLHLEEINCANYPQLIGKTLIELQIRARTGVWVIGSKRGKQHVQLNPPATYTIGPDDRLFIFGTDEQLQKFKDIYLS
ncbi:MAG: hypothetical protein D6730_23735, partial [Bacteroidetes bacterium]